MSEVTDKQEKSNASLYVEIDLKFVFVHSNNTVVQHHASGISHRSVQRANTFIPKTPAIGKRKSHIIVITISDISLEY